MYTVCRFVSESRKQGSRGLSSLKSDSSSTYTMNRQSGDFLDVENRALHAESHPCVWIQRAWARAPGETWFSCDLFVLLGFTVCTLGTAGWKVCEPPTEESDHWENVHGADAQSRDRTGPRRIRDLPPLSQPYIYFRADAPVPARSSLTPSRSALVLRRPRAGVGHLTSLTYLILSKIIIESCSFSDAEYGIDAQSRD
ncbi:hypothetical protein AG1IA_05633 [Rhizoctonia solani AG-1 IA]|uniref:Uncharacterized protein n=1 Tax=Thanatephorus cucumeris (strain AG1-IA) TaxID=983506 RepID=L8WVH5_THACA|nr:hypothetical protein AG1IA_05633 [Rhizoctonia solani AG-1 IA]